MAKRTYTVTAVLPTTTGGDETVNVPGMVVTIPELKAMVAAGHQGHYTQIWCDACGGSIADCEYIGRHIQNIPEHWSTRRDENDARHEDGLASFAG